MLKNKADHKATFEKSLAQGGRFRTKVSTGLDWPDNLYARRYTLVVKSVSDDTVTFDVSSTDIDPRDHRGFNPLEHGQTEVFINDNIHEVIRTGVRAADHAFFEIYTPITNSESWSQMLEHGIKPSPDISD